MTRWHTGSRTNQPAQPDGRARSSSAGDATAARNAARDSEKRATNPRQRGTRTNPPPPRLRTSRVDTVLNRLVVGNSRIGYSIRRRLKRWPADPPPGSLTGTTALVTGAGSGLGLATATGLADLGAEVHLLGRNGDRLRFARAEVLARVRGATVHIEHCDLSVVARVREFAEDFAGRVPRLAVLVHNAGIVTATRRETAEGNEVGFATHVLGPFLLTTLLRTALAAAAPAR